MWGSYQPLVPILGVVVNFLLMYSLGGVTRTAFLP